MSNEAHSTCNASFLAFDGKTHNVDGTEGKIATPNGSLWTKTIFEHTGATPHCCHFVIITMRVICTPLLILVVGGIEIEEVREETTGSDLASQLIEVVVAVLRQIVHATLLLPNLNREDGCFAIAHAFERALQQLTHDASALGTGVCSVVNGREYNLVTATRVDGVHVVDEGFHGLVNTRNRLVDGVLQGALFALQSVKWLGQKVVELYIISS